MNVPTIEDRMERLAREHPGAVLSIRMWHQADVDEMHYIIQLTDKNDAWAATGTSLGTAYVELRRIMDMGE
jgi:hypothetical protein